MNDFIEYEAMRDQGLSKYAIYSVARANGLDLLNSLRMLRSLFDLDLIGAKEVTV